MPGTAGRNCSPITPANRPLFGAVAIFERYAGPEYKHLEMGKPNVSTERRELVVRWISTVGNYDYIFDWVFHDNGTIGIDAGATGIEAVKGVKAKICTTQRQRGYPLRD